MYVFINGIEYGRYCDMGKGVLVSIRRINCMYACMYVCMYACMYCRHLFCRECLQRYAEQTVFGDGRSNLKCMDSSGSVPCGQPYIHIYRNALDWLT